jgi:hypothetical protein
MIISKILAIKNPFVIGSVSAGGVELAEAIPHEALKLVLQVVIAVATLVKFFKERKNNGTNGEKNG